MGASYQAYSEYKNSGLDYYGRIPTHWHIEKIKYNSYVKGRQGWQNLRSDEYQEQGPYLVTGSHFDNNGGVDWGKCHHISEERYDRDSDIWVKEKDVLITKDGTIGKVAFIDFLPDKACLNSHLLIIRDLRYKYDQRFLYHLLSSSCFKGFIPTRQTGTTFMGITQEAIEEFPLVLPPIDEQQRIANFLDHETAKIDTLIEKQQQLIKLLKEKRQAVISHAVTKGLNPDVPMRDSGVEWLGEVPEHWEIMQLRRITSLQQGLQIPQENRFSEAADKRVEYITVKSINAGEAAEHKEYILSPSKRVVCGVNDILLARTGATGQVVTNVSGAFHNNFFKVNYDEKKVLRDYLVYFLRVDEVKNHLLMLAGTTTIPDLNHGAFLGTLACLPNYKEQQKICSFLNKSIIDFDFIEQQAQKFIGLMQERRTALISAAVTGKIDVRNWSAPDAHES